MCLCVEEKCQLLLCVREGCPKMYDFLSFPKIIALFALILMSQNSLFAQRKMEKLDRGVVAIRTSPTAVYIGWRLLGNDTE
jgi:hypothetical protein